MDLRDNARSKETNEIFTGSAAFSCRERIWNGIFHADRRGGHKPLRDVLDLSKRTAKSRVTHMLAGDAVWDTNARDRFLLLANSEETDEVNYRTAWLNKLTTSQFSEIQEVLTDFVNICPDQTWPEPFKQVGKQVREYLTIINSRTKTLSPDDTICKEYLAAGLYSLVCLFLQNATDCTPIFRRPAEAWDPVVKYAEPEDRNDRQEETAAPVIPPRGVLYDSGTPELPFDFFAHVRAEFEKQTHIDEAPPVALATVFKNQNVPPVITPAEIHRKRVRIMRTIPMMDSDFSYEGVFSVEDVLVTQSGEASLSRKLRSAACAVDGASRTWRVESTVFEDDRTDCILALGVAKDPDGNSPYNSWACCMAGDWEYRWKAAAVYLDEAGNRKDLELEHLLAQHGIGTLQEDSPAGPRMAVAKLEPEYLNYFIVNAETMTEIPKYRIPGTDEMAVTLPCPGIVAVVKCPVLHLEPAAQDQLFLQGYLHGCYGLKQDGVSADITMSTGIHEPYMAFQYGAMMKARGDAAQAEPCLRQAAQANIPGAMYELAQLLEQQGKKEEAAALLQPLLEKGYRYYGTIPIKLPEEK